MTLEQMRQFVEVAEKGSFTKAAESLYVSHSALSRCVSSLEQTFDVKLLNRTTRKIELTDAGKMLYDSCRKVLKDAEDLELQMTDLGRSEGRQLLLEMPDFYSEFLKKKIAQFQERYQHIRLILKCRVPSVVLSDVLSGEADAGISYSYLLNNISSDVRHIPLESGRFVAVLSDQIDFPKEKDSISLQELYRTELFQKNDDPMLTLLTTGNEKLIYETKESQFQELMMQVQYGRMGVVLPEHAAAVYEKGYRKLFLSDVYMSYQLELCYLKRRENPALRSLTSGL